MTTQFKFSIITPIYNTGNYLKKNISSIIKQTLNFEKNIQLILVDNGSSDSSKEICLEYQKKYPKNIIVLSEKKRGISFARNLGMKYATGKYITFLDSDDFLSKNALCEVYKFFEKNFDKIDVVAIPLVYFERKNYPQKLNYKFNKTKIIDLIKNPNNPQISICSTFIKKSVLNDFSFEENLICSEDTLLINKILLEKKKMGVISNVKYFYRKRNNFQNYSDKIKNYKDYYITREKKFYLKLIKYCLKKENNIPSFIQYTLAYDLQTLFKLKEIPKCFSENEKKEFISLLKHITGYIGDNAILKNKNIEFTLKPIYLSFRKKNEKINYSDSNLMLLTDNHVLDELNKHRINLDSIELNKNNIYISGMINTRFDNDLINIIGEKKVGNKKEKYLSTFIPNHYRNNKVFLSKTCQFRYNFTLNMPIEKNKNTEIRLFATYHINKNKKDFSRKNIIYINLKMNLKDVKDITYINLKKGEIKFINKIQ